MALSLTLQKLVADAAKTYAKPTTTFLDTRTDDNLIEQIANQMSPLVYAPVEDIRAAAQTAVARPGVHPRSQMMKAKHDRIDQLCDKMRDADPLELENHIDEIERMLDA